MEGTFENVRLVLASFCSRSLAFFVFVSPALDVFSSPVSVCVCVFVVVCVCVCVCVCVFVCVCVCVCVCVVHM